MLSLQRALNVLNKLHKQQLLYSDLKIDGQIGLATLTSLEKYSAHRDETLLLKMLNTLQGAFYVTLAERREKDETFLYGWFKNQVVM